MNNGVACIGGWCFRHETTIREIESRLNESQREEQRSRAAADEKDALVTSLQSDLEAANEWRRQLCLAQDQIQVGVSQDHRLPTQSLSNQIFDDV